METDRTTPSGADWKSTAGGSVQGGKRERRSRRATKLVAAAGATTLAAITAAGVAAASAAGPPAHPSRATVTASTASGPAPGPGSGSSAKHAPAGHPLLGRLLRHVLHGQFVVRTKGGTLQTFDYDRGVLRSATSTTITIAPADTSSSTVSATITSATRFPGLPATQLQPGDRVALVYQGGDAVVIGARAPRSASSSTGS